MSSQKSQNLKLHLWEPDDNFLRTEFNENFIAIDNGLKAVKTELAGKIQTAQETAEMLPYVTGTYTGKGDTQDIYLGFRPSYVIICGLTESTSHTGYTNFFGMTAGNILTNRVFFTDTGFTVIYYDSATDMKIPHLNHPSHTYDYIAFR